MTREEFEAEVIYHRSVSPFVRLEKDGIISEDDLRVIVTTLAAKYRPIFVHYISPN